MKRPGGNLKVIWANDGYGAGVWSRAIGGIIGAELAEMRAEELAQRFNVRLGGAAGDDPELGDDNETYPDLRDEKVRNILFAWIIQVRDELLSVSSS